MAKPILLRKAGRGWHVFVDAEAARRRGKSPRFATWPATGLLPVMKSGGKVDIVPGGTPTTFSKGDADHLAFTIGNYLLGLGQFVDTYTEVDRHPSRDRARRRRRRRDPPEPGEFERNQQKPYQRVLYRVLDTGEVVVIFPEMRKSKTDPRIMLYRMGTGKEWHDRESLMRLARRWLKATPREERPFYLHLTNDHGYRIRT